VVRQRKVTISGRTHQHRRGTDLVTCGSPKRMLLLSQVAPHSLWMPFRQLRGSRLCLHHCLPLRSYLPPKNNTNDWNELRARLSMDNMKTKHDETKKRQMCGNVLAMVDSLFFGYLKVRYSSAPPPRLTYRKAAKFARHSFCRSSLENLYELLG
jgi:hypothetical protein